MIAAIYARKSTEQTGVADEQRSVARQVEHARQYAQRKGWTVDEAAVFIDDGSQWVRGETHREGLALLDVALEWRKQFEGKSWTA